MTENNHHHFQTSIPTWWWSFIYEGRYLKKLTNCDCVKISASRSLIDVPLVSAPSLTLLTAHQHFNQLEILEAPRLPKDGAYKKYKNSFQTRYSFAWYLHIMLSTAHTKNGKLNILRSISIKTIPKIVLLIQQSLAHAVKLLCSWLHGHSNSPIEKEHPQGTANTTDSATSSPARLYPQCMSRASVQDKEWTCSLRRSARHQAWQKQAPQPSSLAALHQHWWKESVLTWPLQPLQTNPRIILWCKTSAATYFTACTQRQRSTTIPPAPNSQPCACLKVPCEELNAEDDGCPLWARLFPAAEEACWWLLSSQTAECNAHTTDSCLHSCVFDSDWQCFGTLTSSTNMFH